MAKIWTVPEAIEALKKRDLKSIQDFGSRYPIFSTASYEEILLAIPTSVSVRMVESVLKAQANLKEVEATETADVVEPTQITDKAETKPSKKVAPVEDDSDEDDDFEEVAPKKKSVETKPVKKPVVAVDDDEDEDEDDDFEEPAPPKKKPVTKPSVDEDDEDEDDDFVPIKKPVKKAVVEDDDDFEEEKPTPKKKASAPPPKEEPKAKKKKVIEDDLDDF